MIIFVCLLLIMLGLVGCEEWVTRTLPPLSGFVAALRRSQYTLGSVGCIVGGLGLFALLVMAFRFHPAFLALIVQLTTVGLLVSLGFLLTYDTAKVQFKDPNALLALKAERAKMRIAYYRQPLGTAAIALGFLRMLAAFF